MQVAVVVLDDVFDLGLSGILDTFTTANELIELSALPVQRFDVRIVGVRSRVRTSQGLRVPLRSFANWRPDWVIVPAIGFKLPAALVKALDRSDIVDVGLALRQWSGHCSLMSAACIGTFIMAESGLLNGHAATTTWWLSPLFRQRYPAIRLDDASMIVKSGRYVSAGAALGHVDLALWLIRTVSPHLAALTARYLIVDSRPSQSAYALSDHLIHSDPVVQKFEVWARSRLKDGFSMEAAARSVGASKRTLARHMQTVLGKSPLAYFQRLRVEHAVHLLRTSDASVDDIAAEVGYIDGATLRALLRRQLNVGIKEIRRDSRVQ